MGAVLLVAHMANLFTSRTAETLGGVMWHRCFWLAVHFSTVALILL
jgi:hypothetical protein